MRLARVIIKNFRSIADETVIFQPSCRVLVGINESGKTNVLRALSLLDPNVELSPDDIRDVGPDEDPAADSEVTFVFATDHADRAALLEAAKVTMLGSVNDVITVEDGKRLSVAQIVNAWAEVIYDVNVRNGNRRFTWWARPKAEIKPGWYKPVQGVQGSVQLDGEVRNLKDVSIVGSPFTDVIDGSLLNALDARMVFSWIAGMWKECVELPDVIFWKYDEANLLPGSISMTEFSEDPNACLPLKHMFALAKQTDPSQALELAQKKKNGVRNLLENVGRAATAHILKVWKEFKGLSIELSQNGPNIEATVKDAYNRFDLVRRSDGFKRFISFLLSVSAKARTKELVNTLYLHDEPDTSLHPSGARYLRDELIKLSETNYVVYSTHSIFMIDRENLARHLIVKKEDERTMLTEVTASNIVDEEVIYNALGYSIFEELKPKNILFEGWRDKRLYQVRVSRLPTTLSNRDELKEAGVCHVKGVSDIGRVTPMLELAQRQWIIVSDADSAAREQQRRYRGAGPWFRYDQLGANAGFVTGEDFIAWSAFQTLLARIANENPSLPAVGAWLSMPGNGKIDKIRKWLVAGGLDSDRVKAALEQIKEAVFKELKPIQILDDYLPILEAIGAKLKALKETVPL
jgi:hypothetical protein